MFNNSDSIKQYRDGSAVTTRSQRVPRDPILELSVMPVVLLAQLRR